MYFEPDEVYACIVTCGGLCPGLNTVIREIVCGLYHMYGVHKVFGIEVGSECSSVALQRKNLGPLLPFSHFLFLGLIVLNSEWL